VPCFYAEFFVLIMAGVILCILAASISFPVSLILFRCGGKSWDKARQDSLVIASLLATTVFCGSTCLLSQRRISGPPSPLIRPNDGDIIGVWQLSEGSLRDIQEEEGYPPSSPKLEFMDDGTFHMTDIPEIVIDHWTINPEKGEYNFCSGTGTWTVARTIQSNRGIRVQLVEFSGCKDEEEEDKEIFWPLSGEIPPYKIYKWAWVFERR
jgi:hypothetical protein